MLFKRSPKSASFDKIRIQILSKWLLKKEESCSVIALTSRLSGEGVSTITTGLIKSFNATDIGIGKTLLLNASLNYQRNTRLLDITDLDNLSNISDYITNDKTLGTDSITLASIPQNIFQIKDQTSSLLSKLKNIYNLILIDAGTLNNSNGTYWLINSDINLLVIDSSRTTSESLEHIKREFLNSKLSIDGSILNKRHFPIPSYLYWLTK